MHAEQFTQPVVDNTTTPAEPLPWWADPYAMFVAATPEDTRVRVDADERSQAVARLLIKQGMCGYRDATGLIANIGVPKRRCNHKRIWKSGAAVSRAA